jgi:hypothetical protein
VLLEDGLCPGSVTPAAAPPCAEHELRHSPYGVRIETVSVPVVAASCCARSHVIASIENFLPAETDRMFADPRADTGGSNQLNHGREPTAIQ